MIRSIRFDLKRGSNVSQKSIDSQTSEAGVSHHNSSNNTNNINDSSNGTTNQRSFPALCLYTLYSFFCCCKKNTEPPSSTMTQTTTAQKVTKSTNTRDFDADSIGSYRTRTSIPDSDTHSNSHSFASEDSLTAPYLEILAKLHKTRENLIKLTVSPTTHGGRQSSRLASTSPRASFASQQRSSSNASYNLLTNDTIADVNWCIEQLELLQMNRESTVMAFINEPLDRTLLVDEQSLNHEDSNPFIPSRISAFGVETPHEAALGLILSRVDTWTVDIFQIDEWSCQRPLTSLMYTLFLQRDLLSCLKIPATTFLNFVIELESKYNKENPFHNSLHAADVTQATHYLLTLPSLRSTFTQLEICCALIAAAVHDVDHPGLTNQYLVNSCSELAIMYNDTSVLENHHLAVAFKLLQNKNCDIFRNIDRKQRQMLRRFIIGMVMSTDMSRHFKLLGKLRAIVDRKSNDPGSPLRLETYVERLVVLENIVHCADLSNPMRPLPLYMRWVALLMEEFYRQGDREREAGLEISPMCDRFRARTEKWQVTFIDTFVFQVIDAFMELVKPELKEVMHQLQMNRAYYVQHLPPEARPSLDLTVTPDEPRSSVERKSS